MPLIRCTRKLLTEMGAHVASSAEEAHDALLGNRYAHLLRIDRRKCVIFTSERTLLTFLVVGLDRDAIRDYATLFQNGLRQLLSPDALKPVKEGTSGLLDAVEESRKRQADLSSVLRENVRQGVELLLDEVSSTNRTEKNLFAGLVAALGVTTLIRLLRIGAPEHPPSSG